MITLSNGHSFEYMVASGALAFDGKGWPWERPLVAAGLIKPHLFTVVIKTLTRQPRKGYLKMWKPWTCVRLIRGGSAINKVGLTNPGMDWWIKKIAPKVDRREIPLVGSIFGERLELIEMACAMNNVDLVGLEVNTSCPNSGDPIDKVQAVVDDVKAVRDVSKHPVIVKASVAQDYLEIVRRLEDFAEAVSLNSVPWEILNYPTLSTKEKPSRSPLWRLENKVGGGGGGVSGRLAQRQNWSAVNMLRTQVHAMPIIGPSVMEYEDLVRVRMVGANAVSFGSIHMLTPCKPTQIVQKEMIEERKTCERKQNRHSSMV